MDISERISWLQNHTVFNQIPEAALRSIATTLQVTPILANRRLVLEDTIPEALLILHSGHIESYRTSPNSIARVVSILSGSVLYLKELSNSKFRTI